MKIAITGGREETCMIEFVDSNYHAKNPGEKLVKIEGPVSADTLKDIILLLNTENDNVN
jgi:L-fucose mutarotase/ribose pyranase (RbsD/FucU family)